jgi:putrescine importer
MGVNAAALARYYVRNPEKRLRNLWPPAAGFVTCLLLWLNLSDAAKFVGASWMIVGVIVGALRTRGFRRGVLRFEATPED